MALQSDTSKWEVSERARFILSVSDVSKKTLSTKDVRFAVKALSPVSGKWEDIGVAAGVKQLDVIKRNCGNNVCLKLISVINNWFVGQYEPDRHNSNAPSWWKIVDIVADDIGGGNPRVAQDIARNWRECAKDNFSDLAKRASKDDLTELNVSTVIQKLIGALSCVSNKWLEIGTVLGIPLDILESFKSQALADGNPISATCLRSVIEEWLSGRYSVDQGYPAPSMMVLVDAVEHPVGGGNPSLAQKLVDLQIPGLIGMHPHVQRTQGDGSPPMSSPTPSQTVPTPQPQLPLSLQSATLSLPQQGWQSAQRSEVFPSLRWGLEFLHSNNHSQLNGARLRGQGIVVAILDGGVSNTHHSLSTKFAQGQISGRNFAPLIDPNTNQPTNDFDPNVWYGPRARDSHGTAVAAVLGGHAFSSTMQDGKIVDIPVGIAPDAHLHICRVFPDSTMHNLENALQYLLQQPVQIDILCMSFKATMNRTVENLLEQLTKKGVLCLAAAGNDGIHQTGADFPACDPNVIAVGALNPHGRKAGFNPDCGIDVYAHGEDLVVPTMLNDTSVELADSTSFSTPMVAGFLALLIQCAKQLTSSTSVVKEYHNFRFVKKLLLEPEICDGQKLIRARKFLTDVLNRHGLGQNYMTDLIRSCYDQNFKP